MKTPDEIKKVLEFGKDNCLFVNGDCKDCAYERQCSTIDGDVMAELPRAMISDALAYIQQLEAERDALMEQAKYAGVCDMCKHEHTPLNELPCKECSLSNRKFEWRGVQKEG